MGSRRRIQRNGTGAKVALVVGAVVVVGLVAFLAISSASAQPPEFPELPPPPPPPPPPDGTAERRLYDQAVREAEYAAAAAAEKAALAATITAGGGWHYDPRGRGYVVTLNNNKGGHDWYEGAVGWTGGTPPVGHAMYPTIAIGAPEGIVGGNPLVPYSAGGTPTDRISPARSVAFPGGYAASMDSGYPNLLPRLRIGTASGPITSVVRGIKMGLLGLLR